MILMKGSIGLVHLYCLEIWINIRQKKYCEICRVKYPVERSLRYGKLSSIPAFFRDPYTKQDWQPIVCDFVITNILTAIIWILWIVWAFYLFDSSSSDYSGLSADHLDDDYKAWNSNKFSAHTVMVRLYLTLITAIYGFISVIILYAMILRWSTWRNNQIRLTLNVAKTNEISSSTVVAAESGDNNNNDESSDQ